MQPAGDEVCPVSVWQQQELRSNSERPAHSFSSMCQQTAALQAAPWLIPDRLTSHSVDSVCSGCDSSDCLLCQFSMGPCDLHAELPRHRQRRPSWNQSATGVKARKRLAADGPSGLSSPVRAELEQLGLGPCGPGLLPKPWQWQPAYASQQQPAPAHMALLAQLLPGAPGHQAHLRRSSVSAGGIVSSLDFNPDGTLLAAGSVNKEVRLYRIPDLGSAESEGAGGRGTVRWRAPGTPLLTLKPVTSQNTPGKVGCLSWDPICEGLVTIGDYDGTLYQVHLPSGHHVAEVEAHAGRRIWSVAHSKLRSHLCASASEDGTACLWSGRGLATEALVIRPPQVAGGRSASVCCCEFSPYDEHAIALASADGAVYLYDLRMATAPQRTLRHHSRAASYVRFMGRHSLVSSGTDGTVAVWDLQQGSGQDEPRLDAGEAQGQAAAATQPAAQPQPGAADGSAAPWKVMKGHRNEKNFVGLSVLPEAGLIACGSETGSAYAYHTSWTEPLAATSVTALAPVIPGASRPSTDAPSSMGIVSSVCWQPTVRGATGVLAAGTWCGDISLLVLAEGKGESAVSRLLDWH